MLIPTINRQSETDTHGNADADALKQKETQTVTLANRRTNFHRRHRGEAHLAHGMNIRRKSRRWTLLPATMTIRQLSDPSDGRLVRRSWNSDWMSPMSAYFDPPRSVNFFTGCLPSLPDESDYDVLLHDESSGAFEDEHVGLLPESLSTPSSQLAPTWPVGQRYLLGRLLGFCC